MKAKMTCSVVVIYQSKEAREEAVKFCDRLIERFWAGYEFDVNWCGFDVLGEARAARDASLKAVEADLIIFATGSGAEIPAEIKEWVETWAGQRGDREGALVGLMDPGPGLSGVMAEKFVYLRSVAHRGGMDYLTQAPQELSRTIPDSIESYTERADQVTSVLDEILHYKAPHSSLLG
jgi:hypothetical protein